MDRTLVLGAGAIGSTYARLLVERGEAVTVASRSGTAVAGATTAVLDAADTEAVSRAAETHNRIVVATNPPYWRWRELWPPVADAVSTAAARSGIDVLLVGNLYAYGEGSAMPMTEGLPLNPTEPKAEVRRDVWEGLLDCSRTHGFRVAEVRASDYYGPGCPPEMHLGPRFFAASAAGRAASLVGDPSQPHSWAFLPDIARTIDAAASADGTWGRAWHVPAHAASGAEVMRDLNALTGGSGSVKGIPPFMLTIGGLFSPLIKAARTSVYQFTAPFVSDSGETERMLGVAASDWTESLRTTLAALGR